MHVLTAKATEEHARKAATTAKNRADRLNNRSTSESDADSAPDPGAHALKESTDRGFWVSSEIWIIVAGRVSGLAIAGTQNQ